MKAAFCQVRLRSRVDLKDRLGTIDSWEACLACASDEAVADSGCPWQDSPCLELCRQRLAGQEELQALGTQAQEFGSLQRQQVVVHSREPPGQQAKLDLTHMQALSMSPAVVPAVLVGHILRNLQQEALGIVLQPVADHLKRSSHQLQNRKLVQRSGVFCGLLPRMLGGHLVQERHRQAHLAGWGRIALGIVGQRLGPHTKGDLAEVPPSVSEPHLPNLS